MNILTIGIGLLPCIYALFILRARLKGFDKYYSKLEPMRKKFGETPGFYL